MPETPPTEHAAPDGRLFHPGDLGAALMLLTRLPVPPGRAADRGGRAAWAWPIVGLIVGAIAAGVAGAALALGLSSAIAAGLALGASILSTGALHEDGLADCADGFWGARDRDRRLEIMKDSRIGTYGMLALILAVGLRWLALTALLAAGQTWAALVVPAALSRGAMAGVMAVLPFARGGGVARHVGRPGRGTTAVALLIAGLLALGLAGIGASVAIGAVGLTAFVVARIAMAKIGGQTGDVLGAVQQLTEIAALLGLVTVLT